jgi:hypothetical protein
MSKPWGATKGRGGTDRSTALEMSDWLVEMLARGADREGSETRAELKERAVTLYAQLRSSLEDAEDA